MPRRRALPPLPQGNPKGTYFRDANTGKDVFVTFEELSQMCNDLMEADESLTGKPFYTRDQTYNLRKPR